MAQPAFLEERQDFSTPQPGVVTLDMAGSYIDMDLAPQPIMEILVF